MENRIDFYKMYSNGKIYFSIHIENILVGKLINSNENNKLKNNFHFMGNEKMINVFDLYKIIDTIKYLNITGNLNI